MNRPDGRWLEVNDRLCAILGRPRDEMVTLRWADLTHPDDIPASIQAHDRLRRGESELETLDKRYLRPDGSAVWCRVGLSAVRDRRGRLDAVVTVVEDVDERHRAAERLAQHMAFQDLITEVAEELVAVPADDLDTTVERALARVGGRAGAEHVFVAAVDTTTERPLVFRWDDPAAHADAELLPDPATASQAALRGRKGLDALIAEAEKHGWRSLVVHPVATEPPVVGLAGLGTTSGDRTWDDETLELVNGLAEVIGRALARRAYEVEITHQALHDDLTGLANRVLFLDRLATALRQAERHRRFPSVLYVDLDRFKVINDSLGHDVGDRVLREVATRLEASVRAGDTAARLGGDEFAVLCLRTDDDEDPETAAAEISGRILDAVARPVEVAGRTLAVSASVGVVHATPGVTADTMLRDADVAMYRAKAAGRNRIETFTSAMHDEAVARLALESELRRALDDDQLELHYQVVYRIEDRRPVGIEALVRWRHPTRGLLFPGQFLEVAADAGLDGELDRQVLAEATRTAATWHRRGVELPVWVNISPGFAGRPEFVDGVTEALTEAELPATALGIEITERALIGDLTRLTASLGRLRALGVHLAIDDFGTGLLSLSLLRDLQIEDLKVDRAFIDSVTVGENDGEVVRSVVSLAHSLGLSVVAEGTETSEQLAALTAAGCDRAQGYLLGRPVPFVELTLVQHLEIRPGSTAPRE
nr:GGDEF domain-containing phosphodiesterase [Rhabdothermincola salaria]